MSHYRKWLTLCSDVEIIQKGVFVVEYLSVALVVIVIAIYLLAKKLFTGLSRQSATKPISSIKTQNKREPGQFPFKIPQMPVREGVWVNVVDKTDYWQEFLGQMDEDDIREYRVSDFKEDLKYSNLDISIDTFESRLSHSALKMIDIDLPEGLTEFYQRYAADIEDEEPPIYPVESELLVSLQGKGLVDPIEPDWDVRYGYLSDKKIDEIRRLCDENDIQKQPRKDEMIKALLDQASKLEFPVFVKAGRPFIDFMEQLAGKYITEVNASVKGMPKVYKICAWQDVDADEFPPKAQKRVEKLQEMDVD